MTAKPLPRLSVLVITHDDVVCSEHLDAQASIDVQPVSNAFEGSTGAVSRHIGDRNCHQQRVQSVSRTLAIAAVMAFAIGGLSSRVDAQANPSAGKSNSQGAQQPSNRGDKDQNAVQQARTPVPDEYHKSGGTDGTGWTRRADGTGGTDGRHGCNWCNGCNGCDGC